MSQVEPTSARFNSIIEEVKRRSFPLKPGEEKRVKKPQHARSKAAGSQKSGPLYPFSPQRPFLFLPAPFSGIS
jgi:hypothetical protein